jgi:hypothetical protein
MVVENSPLHPECDYEYTRSIVGANKPVTCFPDTNYFELCLYKVEGAEK